MFAEKVSPGIHDLASTKEDFGLWKELFMEDRFTRREEFLATHSALRLEEETLARAEQRKEHEVHVTVRQGMVIKYFSERLFHLRCLLSVVMCISRSPSPRVPASKNL